MVSRDAVAIAQGRWYPATTEPLIGTIMDASNNLHCDLDVLLVYWDINI